MKILSNQPKFHSPGTGIPIASHLKNCDGNGAINVLDLLCMDNRIVGTAGITNNLTFSYDANGNPLTANGRAYTYNHFNKPATVTAGGVTTNYSYGPDYARLTKAQGSPRRAQ